MFIRSRLSLRIRFQVVVVATLCTKFKLHRIFRFLKIRPLHLIARSDRKVLPGFETKPEICLCGDGGWGMGDGFIAHRDCRQGRHRHSHSSQQQQKGEVSEKKLKKKINIVKGHCKYNPRRIDCFFYAIFLFSL